MERVGGGDIVQKHFSYYSTHMFPMSFADFDHGVSAVTPIDEALEYAAFFAWASSKFSERG